MPKPWKDVIASPQYQSLSPQQQSEAQNQYFDTVVAPQVGDNAAQARQEFFSAYPEGMLERGNIDLHSRPIVKNEDGSISTVRSMSTNIDGREVLVPTVSDDGRIMSDDEAIDNFMRTGKHLGMFSNPDAATSYAESLHNQQADEYLPKTENKNAPNDGNKLDIASQLGLGVGEAGRSIAQAAVNTANIIPEVGDAVVSAGAWLGSQLGIGDGTYTPASRIELPDQLKPQTSAGQVAASAIPYLINPVNKAAAAGGSKLANLAAENAVGVLADNSNNNNNPDKLAQDFATSAALSGVTRGITNAVGAGYRAAKGAISPEAKAATEFAESNNLPLMTSDVAQPGTFAGRSAQALGEKIPIAGTGGMRRGQQEARSQLVQDYAEKYGKAAPDDIVQSLRRQTNKVKQAAGSRLSDIQNQMAAAGAVRPTAAIDALDAEISNLSKLGKVSDTQTISKLQAYRDELSGATDFNQLRNLRTQFRQDVKGERNIWPSRSEASVNRVYSALTGDLDNAVSSNLGPATASKYRQANAAYANEAQLVNNTRLKNVLQKGDLTPEVVNNLLFSSKPSEVKQLYASLDSKGRSAARTAVIGKAYERSGGSPDKFLNEVNRIGSQTGILFKGADKQYLNGLTNYLDSTRRAAKAGAVTPTGQEILQFGAPAAVATDLVGGGGLATGSFAAYGALARAYESKPARTAMLRLANTPKGSTAFEKQLEVVNRALTAAAQGAKN